MTDAPLATVAILTYNGETYLGELLSRVLDQQIDGRVEVLVIDSGSTDRTLEIVASFPSVRLHEIPNSEFGHGRTRNLAASLANGEFIAFLTHDAIPANSDWLRQLLLPFELSDRVVLVTGSQKPRSHSFPLQKYEIMGAFGSMGPEAGTTLFFADPSIVQQRHIDQLGFHSDVNAAMRRTFLLDTIPFRDVSYAEDQMLGRDVIAAGLIKAYAPRAVVEHSNDLTLHEYGKRIFDETVGLRRIGAAQPPMGRRRMLIGAVKGSIGDTYRILRDRDFPGSRKLYWLVVNPWFQLTKWRNLRKATLVSLDDEAAISSGSLEHSRKNRNSAQ
jgi:rhamnosyltransferase